MATRIEVGETYTATRFRSGENSQGPWEMAVVKSGKGSRSVLVFATNVPCGVVEGGNFTVDKIQSVVVKAAKDDKGNWTKTETIVNAEITAEKTARLGEAYEDFDLAYDLNEDLF